MKKIFRNLSLLFVAVIILSSISFGAEEPMSLEQAYKALSKDKGKNSYILGKFQLMHTMDPNLVDEKNKDYVTGINTMCKFKTTMTLVNEKNRKVSSFEIKPVNGSASAYYHIAEKLEKNTQDPYWVLEVPAGTYEFTDLICTYTFEKPGFYPWKGDLFNVPVAKVGGRTVKISTQAKQIVYIGDYDGSLITNITIYADSNIFPYRIFKLNITDNFESVKSDFLNRADDKTKEKLNEFEFISALAK